MKKIPSAISFWPKEMATPSRPYKRPGLFEIFVRSPSLKRSSSSGRGDFRGDFLFGRKISSENCPLVILLLEESSKTLLIIKRS